MQVEQTPLDGLIILTPDVYSDDRGYFFESYNETRFQELTGLQIDWKQDNESYSKKGTLRGLHYQLPPFAQDKLVRVAQGSVYDVVVDMRKASPTFGKAYGLELSAANKKQMFIPKGFAHGFQVLEDETLFVYKCSEVYHAASDRCLKFNDAHFAIEWPLSDPLLSAKDQQAPGWNEIEKPF